MSHLFIIFSEWHLDLATEWLHNLYPVVTVFVRELPRSHENSIGKANEGFRATPMNLCIRKTGPSQADNLIGNLSNDDSDGNKKSRLKVYFYFIFVLQTQSTKTVNYPGTKLVEVAFKLRKRMRNSPSCVHVLHNTLDLVI